MAFVKDSAQASKPVHFACESRFEHKFKVVGFDNGRPSRKTH